MKNYIEHLKAQVKYWQMISAIEKEKNIKLEEIINKIEKNTNAKPCQSFLSFAAGHFLIIMLGKEAKTKPTRQIMPAVLRLKRAPKNNAIGTSV